MYCTHEDLEGYVYAKYLDTIEEKVPGVIERHIEAVCSEIDDALRPRFTLPLSVCPATIKRIAEVMAAYRAVGSLTTLMMSEASSANEWLPLQTQYKEVRKLLEAIADGSMDVGLEALGNETDDLAEGIVTKTRKPRFTDSFWRRF